MEHGMVVWLVCHSFLGQQILGIRGPGGEEMGRRGRYSETFMREAVAMVTPDRTVQEVAVRLGIAPGTLWNWVEKHRIAATVPREPRAPEVVDKTVHDAALERIRELEAENAFLGKSAAYFATKASRRT